MPRLRGYIERWPFNVYDSFGPRETVGNQTLHLLYSRNETPTVAESRASIHRTNVLAPGSVVACDQTAWIGNWYARTNVVSGQFKAAWDAWTHVTTVTMTMGTRSVRQLPLSDLLGRHESQPIDSPPATPPPAALFPSVYHRVAEELYEAHTGVLNGWPQLTPVDKDRWYDVSRRAYTLYVAQHSLICPPRQVMSIDVISEKAATAALLEIMPTNVAPQALVWIHIEGLSVTEVA